MKELIKDKAASAGFSKEDFQDHFDELEVKDPTNRDEHVKNLSLKLLSAHSPTQVLAIFEEKYIKNRSEQHGENREVYIEELFMLLYFFKT